MAGLILAGLRASRPRPAIARFAGSHSSGTLPPALKTIETSGAEIATSGPNSAFICGKDGHPATQLQIELECMQWKWVQVYTTKAQTTVTKAIWHGSMSERLSRLTDRENVSESRKKCDLGMRKRMSGVNEAVYVAMAAAAEDLREEKLPILQELCKKLEILFSAIRAQRETYVNADEIFEAMQVRATTHETDKERCKIIFPDIDKTVEYFKRMATKETFKPKDTIAIYNWMNALVYYRGNESLMELLAQAPEVKSIILQSPFTGPNECISDVYFPGRGKGPGYIKPKQNGQDKGEGRMLGDADGACIAKAKLPMLNGVSGTTYKMLLINYRIFKDKWGHKEAIKYSIELLKGPHGFPAYMSAHNYHTLTETTLAALHAIKKAELENLDKADIGDRKVLEESMIDGLVTITDHLLYKEFLKKPFDLSEAELQKLWLATAYALGDSTHDLISQNLKKNPLIQIDHETPLDLELVIKEIIERQFKEYVSQRELEDKHGYETALMRSSLTRAHVIGAGCCY